MGAGRGREKRETGARSTMAERQRIELRATIIVAVR